MLPNSQLQPVVPIRRTLIQLVRTTGEVQKLANKYCGRNQAHFMSHWAQTSVQHLALISGVKYLSKNTLKYYLSRFGGYLDITLLLLHYIPEENLYFLLHTFSLIPKSTRHILNAQQDSNMVQITYILI